MHSFHICEQVAIDLIENITESHNGDAHIIVAINMFTRFVETKAVPDKAAPPFTQFLVECCGRYGVSKSILSYNSMTFINASTSEVMKVFSASHVRGTPQYLQANAVVERVSQTIEEKIRLVLDDLLQDRDWDSVLPIAPYQLTWLITSLWDAAHTS